MLRRAYKYTTSFTTLCRRRRNKNTHASTAKRNASNLDNTTRRSSLNPLAWYSRKLESHPLTTKCLTSGFLSGLGNITCQYIEHQKKENTNTVTGIKHSEEVGFHVDWTRTSRFVILGTALIAPTVHYWYGYLGRMIPGNSMRKVLERTALDQFFFAPMFIPTFMTSLMLLEGKSLIDPTSRGEIFSTLKRDGPVITVSNWTLWVPAMLINFKYVPIQWQVLYSNSVGYIWNVYLSWKLNDKNE